MTTRNLTPNLKKTDKGLLIKDSDISTPPLSAPVLFKEAWMPRKKNSDSGIVYCNYIPMALSKEEWEKRDREFRANKTYAKVSLKHPNPNYRGKRGIIWETSVLDGEEQCLLEIETVNRVGENGFSTLVGVMYPTGYTKIWFPKAILEGFEEYDENGELKRKDDSKRT